MLSIKVKALVRLTPLSVILIGGFLIINGMTQAKYDKIAESCKIQLVAEAAEVPVASTTTAEEVVVENPAEVPADIDDVYVSPINWAELQDRNPDAKFWISITDTSVDYPVMSAEIGDNEYLHQDIDNEYSFAGSVYTWEGTNLVFGHQMKNGTMFHDLDSDEFVAEGHIITFYSEEGEQEFVPVSNILAKTYGEEGALVEGPVTLKDALCSDEYLIFQVCTYGGSKDMKRFIVCEKVF